MTGDEGAACGNIQSAGRRCRFWPFICSEAMRSHNVRGPDASRKITTTASRTAVNDTVFVGLGASYESLWLDGNVGTSGDGDRFQLGGVVKMELDDWTFSAVGTGGYIWYDVTRDVITPSGNMKATSSPEIGFASVTGRIARAFDATSFYLTPAAEAGFVYQHLDGFSESGASDFDLRISSDDYTTALINPSLEIGTDFGTDGGEAHALARGGLLRIIHGSTRDLSVSFADNSTGTGFTISLSSEKSYADLSLGLDAQLGDNTSLSIAGHSLLADDYTAFGGAVELRLNFLFPTAGRDDTPIGCCPLLQIPPSHWP